jgi:hypothetical protein
VIVYNYNEKEMGRVLAEDIKFLPSLSKLEISFIQVIEKNERNKKG